MENLLQLKDGSKAYGSKTLFDRASFSINEGEHVGVIGPNGAGKTTLFRILNRLEELDSGTLIRSRSLRLGYLAQHDEWVDGELLSDFVERGAALDPWEIRSLGRSLGLVEEHFSRPVQSFSGGYRMRAKLLRLVATSPNLMLLDEPTNYLDLETLLVLEKFLQGYSGAFLLISHDREFLRRTTDHILEVEAGEITKYNGNIDDYFEQKSLLREQLQARALSLEEKRKQILDFVARFGAKATKASQAQSRLKSLDRMEKIELKPVPVGAKIRIPPPAKTGKKILQISNATLGYGNRIVLSNLDLLLTSGQRVGVVGVNGAGKSTLLKGIAGEIQPLKGSIEKGVDTTFAFFNQFVAEKLDLEDTVFESMSREAHPEVRPQDILDLAGSLLFSGDDVKKKIRVLSGGERSRVALGRVLLKKASCLVLDEPTNHLDFQTVEALTQALSTFSGTVVVVSHDRGFIGRIANQILEISNGKANQYPGTYDEYVWSVERGQFYTLAGKAPLEKINPKSNPTLDRPSPSPSAQTWEQKRENEKRLRQLENRIKKLETLSQEHEKAIQDYNALLLAASGDAIQSRDLITKMGEHQTQLEKVETEWLECQEEIERLK